MKLSFVTSNKGKFEEARAALSLHGIELLHRLVPHPEIQADTLEEVARERARFLRGAITGEPYFVDDAGLFVDALAGFPGVYSAYSYRTIGVAGILRLLAGEANRAARFEAVLAYMEPASVAPVLVKGVCRGRILETPEGAGGFGFDPVFAPDGHTESFARLPLSAKNELSHRGRALAKLVEHLRAAGKIP